MLNLFSKYVAINETHNYMLTEIVEDNQSSGDPPGSQLKVVGRLADQCQDALVQLGTFLASSHAPDEYAARLPPLQVNIFLNYNISISILQ